MGIRIGGPGSLSYVYLEKGRRRGEWMGGVETAQRGRWKGHLGMNEGRIINAAAQDARFFGKGISKSSLYIAVMKVGVNRIEVHTLQS